MGGVVVTDALEVLEDGHVRELVRVQVLDQPPLQVAREGVDDGLLVQVFPRVLQHEAGELQDLHPQRPWTFHLYI